MRHLIKHIVLSGLLLGVFVFFPKSVLANQFPNDSVTKSLIYEGVNSGGDIVTVPAGQTWTLLNFCSVQSGQYNVVAYDSANILAVLQNNYTTQSSLQYCWDGRLKLVAGKKLTWYGVSSNYKSVSINYTYVPYDLSLVSSDNTSLNDIKNNTANTSLTLSAIAGGLNFNTVCDFGMPCKKASNMIELISNKINDIGHYILIAIYLVIFFLFIRFLYRIFFYGL